MLSNLVLLVTLVYVGVLPSNDALRHLKAVLLKGAGSSG